MSKMTDEEIIKALECCDDFGWCGQCLLQGVIDCKTVLTDNALDLINRQQAEIERLNADVKLLTTYKENLITDKEHLITKLKTAEFKAIKEVEVKIHEKLHQAEMHGNFEPVVTREMFDSVVKEMVGEGK